jgi:hypothetical protein
VNADGITTECIDKKCKSGYGRKSTDLKCHACPNNCLTCEDKIDPVTSLPKGVLECTTCASYFILNDGVCGSCPINCETCSYVNEFGLQCSACKDKHTFDTEAIPNCLPCPASCDECAYDATDKKTKCKAGKCMEGYQLAADGTCKRCSELTFSNCGTCTDVVGNGTDATSTCLECATGFTMKETKDECLSCQISPTSNCQTCVDPVGKYCTECNDAFLRSKDGRVCGYSCTFCNGTSCETPAANGPSEVCASCWTIGQYNPTTELVTSYFRGCSDLACTAENLNENCQTISSLKECKKCCNGPNCNTGKLLDLTRASAGAIQVSMITMLMAVILALSF